MNESDYNSKIDAGIAKAHIMVAELRESGDRPAFAAKLCKIVREEHPAFYTGVLSKLAEELGR